MKFGVVIFPGSNCDRDMIDALKNDLQNAKLLNDELMEGYEYLFGENNPAGVKAALSELGIIENYLRLPVTPLGKDLHTKLAAYIAKF